MTENAAEPTDSDDVSEDMSAVSPAEIDAVAAQVAAYDEALGEAVAKLGGRLQRVEAENESLNEDVEELTDRVQRVQADFQNYKKRAERRQEELEARATEDLVERLLEVRDNLDRALDQEEDTDVRDGIQATVREFDHVLAEEGVDRIDPDPGEPVDPRRHEVLHRETEDADTITSVYRPGYVMADKVLRPAQVTVGADPDGGGGATDQDGSSGSTADADTPDSDEESA